jgi:hypothetical protein
MLAIEGGLILAKLKISSGRNRISCLARTHIHMDVKDAVQMI